ncbi:MAG: hypothetical protein ACRDOK_01545 [Streptosporangiaceae bacterium]
MTPAWAAARAVRRARRTQSARPRTRPAPDEADRLREIRQLMRRSYNQPIPVPPSLMQMARERELAERP